MNRRSFLKFCGIAPVVPGLVVEAMEKQRTGVYTIHVKVTKDFQRGGLIQIGNEQFKYKINEWQQIEYASNQTTD